MSLPQRCHCGARALDIAALAAAAWAGPGYWPSAYWQLCPAFYFSAIRPEQERLERRATAPVLHEQLALGGKSLNGTKLSPEEQLADFTGDFPTRGILPVAGKTGGAGGKPRTQPERGGIQGDARQGGKAGALPDDLAGEGQYPQIRKFLTVLPDTLPAVALENVQFERQKIADPNVEAKIKLVLYLEQAS